MFCRKCGAKLNDGQEICLSCGVEAGKGNSFCPNCGKPVFEEAVICVGCGVSLKRNQEAPAQTPAYAPVADTRNIPVRSIITAIILSLVTCGIYAIYWFVCLTDEMNAVSGRKNDTSGGLAFILSLVTCGIYSYFWAYKMGEKRDIVANEKGSSGILYLILQFLGLGIVVYCLAQDTINKAVGNK